MVDMPEDVVWPDAPKSQQPDMPPDVVWPDSALPPKAAPIQEAKKPEREMPSVGSALFEGVGAGFRHAGEGIQTLRGVTPEQPQQESPAAAPLEWGDVTSPVSKLAPKLAYGLGESSPTLVGGLAGGATGAMTPVPGGALIGGALGAGAGAALQTIGPVFGEELKKSPNDPDGAWTRAIERAATSGATAGLGWGLFGVGSKALEPLKHMAFQAFGVQPGVSVAGQAAQNVIQGKPVTENLGQSYATGAVGTALPMAGHAVLNQVFRAEAQSVAQTRAQDPILSRIGEPPEPNKGSWSQRFNDFYTDLKDDLNPMRQAENVAAGTERITPENSPYIAARLTRGSTGRAEHFVDYGTFNAITGDRTGPGLRQILAPAEGDMDGFRKYAISRRAIEKFDQDGVDTGVPIPEARAAVAAGNAKFARPFQEWLKYHDNVLDYMVDSGIVSRQSRANMREQVRNYVPFYRVMEEAGVPSAGAGPGLQARNPLHSMGESQLQLIDPIETTIRNTYTFIALADRNRALQKLEALPASNQVLTKVPPQMRPIHVTGAEAERGQIGHNQGPPLDDFTIFRPNAFRPAPDEIRIFNDGKATTYKTDPRLAGAVSGMDRESVGALTRFLAHPARLLRAGATLSPEFIVRNPVRDQFSAFVFSTFGRGYVPIIDLVKGAGQAWSHGEGYQKWLRDGGANSAMVSIDRNYVENLVRRMKDPTVMGTMRNVLRSPLEILRMASEFTENATRVGEHMRLTKLGQSREASGFGAREITLDFQRIGAKMRAVNQIVSFFNAQLEGVDRAGRALYANPQRFLPAVFASITLPSLYLAWANRDDPRMKEIPRWEKDIFWIVPTNNWQPVSAQDAARAPQGYTRQNKETGQWEINKGNIYRIPKPFELGVAFGSLPERIFEAYWKKDPNAYKGIGSSLQKAFLPPYLPQAASPLIEQFANRSLFTDRPLVPEYLKGLLPEFRANPYTTDTAKVIGKVVSKVLGRDSDFASPIIVENYIRAWTGGLGQHALSLSDAALRGAGIVPSKIAPTLTNADKTIMKAFAVRFPEAGANSIQDFYDEFNKRTQVKKTATYLQKTGEPEDAAELRRSGALATADQIYKAMNAQMKMVRNAYLDKKMTPDEKRNFIDMSYLQAIKMAQVGMKVFQDTDEAFKKKKEGAIPVSP